MYKTLVTTGGRDYFVFVIPIAKELDLKAAARSVGQKSVEMIHVRDINKVTGYIRGGCTAIGMKKQYVTRIDSTAKELEKIIESLEMEMTKVFREKFGEISREFERVFKKLFDGGEAKLSLTDSENVLESGIDIFVAPPGKVIKSMSLLSGGEQALTSIALYFAILNIHPAPFCLLDEIEAALDDVNVSRYAEYLHRLTANTQLITITHRRGTMEIADRLYGVTMREKGISKILMINVDEIERNLQPT